jgi:hypothetical protein
LAERCEQPALRICSGRGLEGAAPAQNQKLEAAPPHNGGVAVSGERDGGALLGEPNGSAAFARSRSRPPPRRGDRNQRQATSPVKCYRNFGVAARREFRPFFYDRLNDLIKSLKTRHNMKLGYLNFLFFAK